MASTPPTNQAFLREVDEELRRDQARNFWRRYGRWLIAGVIVALALFGGWLWWENRREAKAGVEGEQLSAAIDDLAAGKQEGLGAKLQALSGSDSDGTRAAAKVTLADMALEKGDAKGAAAQFAAIAGDASLDQSFRDMALIRQTAAEYDSLTPQAVIDRLKPLAVAGNPWFGSAGEMVAVAYIRLNKPELAGATFAAIAKDEAVPDTIRSRVVQLSGVMGVDAIPAPASDKGNN